MLRAVAITAVAACLLPTAALAHELPLGSPRLHETRTTGRLAPGVTYTKIVRGELSAHDGWTVDVAVVADRAAADALAARLRQAGFDAQVSTLPGPPDAHVRGPFAFRVRSGLFTARPDADAQAAAIQAAGLPVHGAVFTAVDGGPTSGPWVVHVLSIDPSRYRGAVTPTLANDVVVDRETLTSLSARAVASAATFPPSSRCTTSPAPTRAS